MDFEKLNRHIPYCIGHVEKTATVKPYPYIELQLPGRHQYDTVPIGGDFVVKVSDKGLCWRKHEFSHRDVFKYIEARNSEIQNDLFMHHYLRIILGAEPEVGSTKKDITMLRAMQCLAVAEHRRYKQHEPKWGGRYLPFRFAAGIAERLWSANDASNLEQRGRPGVEYLEFVHGLPILTKELMNG